MKHKAADGHVLLAGDRPDATCFCRGAPDKEGCAGCSLDTWGFAVNGHKSGMADHEGFVELDGANNDVQDVTADGPTLNSSLLADAGGLSSRTVDEQSRTRRHNVASPTSFADST